MRTKRSETIRIEGMRCGRCVKAVERALEGLAGVDVRNVEVGAAQVSYDPGRVSRERLGHAVEEAGFSILSFSAGSGAGAASEQPERASRPREGRAEGRRRRVEVFTAGCPVCDEAVRLVEALACPSCEVAVLDMRQEAAASRARALGVRSVPAVAIDGRLAGCCAGRGPREEVLRAEGLGQPL